MKSLYSLLSFLLLLRSDIKISLNSFPPVCSHPGSKTIGLEGKCTHNHSFSESFFIQFLFFLFSVLRSVTFLPDYFRIFDFYVFFFFLSNVFMRNILFFISLCVHSGLLASVLLLPFLDVLSETICLRLPLLMIKFLERDSLFLVTDLTSILLLLLMFDYLLRNHFIFYFFPLLLILSYNFPDFRIDHCWPLIKF